MSKHLIDDLAKKSESKRHSLQSHFNLCLMQQENDKFIVVKEILP